MKIALRDIFWAILVIAIALGWWISQPPIRGYSEGHFSIDGKPVANGRVFFESKNGELSVARIVNGKYQIWLESIGDFTVTLEVANGATEFRTVDFSSDVHIWKDARNTFAVEISERN